MAFTQAQIRKLAGKLAERFVKTRSERGMTLSYVEGWHVIDEANRVFGFDGWDRETVAAECVWQDIRLTPKACSYAVRVRIKVRAGKTVVSREGTGIGHGTGATLGEAHESALKEAETDATKRALVTFGNLFGLALYDKEQAGVERANRDESSAAMAWTVFAGNSAPPRSFATPQQFCTAARETLTHATTTAELEALWTGNAPTVAQLRAVRPELRTKNGTHYADLLESLYRGQQLCLQQKGEAHQSRVADRDDVRTAEPPAADTSAFTVPTLRRIRDGGHLRYVAALTCLVCGRTPSHAHHLRFAQLRSLGSKPSDEWIVPLCPIHHRSLHDAGREDEWWQAKGIDAKAEAEKLWLKTHGPSPAVSDIADPQKPSPPPGNPADERPPSGAGASEQPKAQPTDSQGEPIPINLGSDIAG